MKPVSPLTKYAGLGTQLITGLLILMYLGKKADAYFKWERVLTWIFPAIFIIYTLIRIVKETQPKK